MPGNSGSRGNRRGRSLTSYLKDMLEKQDTTGRPIKALLAEKAVQIALNPETSNKDFMFLMEQFMDRETGKPVNTNINAELVPSPFEDISTEALESLINKAKQAQQEIDKERLEQEQDKIKQIENGQAKLE